MAAIDSFRPKFYEDVPQYSYIEIDSIKAKIQEKNRAAFQVSGIKQDCVDIEQISNFLGSKEFLEEYTNILTKLLQDIPKDFFAGNGFFDINGDIGFSATTLNGADCLNEELDNTISVLRNAINIAFPGEDYSLLRSITSITDNEEFLRRFESIAQDARWPQIGELHGHIKGLSSKYAGLKNGYLNDLEALNSNLKNVVGQIIWENIAKRAREIVLKKFFEGMEEEIIKALDGVSSENVTIRVYSTIAGTDKNTSGKQEVADSLVTLEIIDKSSDPPTILCKISTADSTKLKQKASTGGILFKDTSAQEEIHSLGQLLLSVQQKTYWEERLKAFLSGSPSNAKKAKVTNIDAQQWLNTYTAFYLLALYDTIAVRATTSGIHAQTLTINNKIRLIGDIITSIPDKDIKNRAIKDKNNIFKLGMGYDEYTKTQADISSGGTGTDEWRLKVNYQMYLSQILNTKISISRNVSYFAMSRGLT